MSNATPHLTELTEAASVEALNKFYAIRSCLDGGATLADTAKMNGVSLRTAQNWVAAYRQHGLAGLSRKPRADRASRRIAEQLVQLIEGLALRKPQRSVAVIHREACAFARHHGCREPSDTVVTEMIRGLNPALVTLAHEGTKAFSETYDLVRRTEAAGPNAIRQADHCLPPIRVSDDRGKAQNPWLTIVLDDDSRAVAVYYLTFNAPSAMQTALALRQAV